VFGGLPVHAAQGAAALFPAPVDQMPWAHITAVLDDLGSREAVLVEPSTSVNRKVTTPEGAAARSADTPAESHNRPLLPRTSADPARSHAGKAWRSAILAGRITAAIWHMLGSTR
jgi:hypothetical protein